MSDTFILANLVQKGASTGAIAGGWVGCVLGLPLFLIGALFGIVIGMFIGFGVGLISAFALAVIIRYFPSAVSLPEGHPYRHTLTYLSIMTCAGICTYLSSNIIVSSGSMYFTIIPTVCGMILSIPITRNLMKWYMSETSENPDML